MNRLVLTVSSSLALLALGSAAPLPDASELANSDARPDELSQAQISSPATPPPAPQPPPPPPPPPPPTAEEALSDGVLVVVSIPSQRAFVFRKGELWDTTRVSTGKTGKETPVGTYPILQKKKLHRSTLYDDAPMPFMQRLTWDGVALHAGRVPGYPASHGCIRLPRSFAKDLYRLTNFSNTVVIVTDERVTSADTARELV